MLESASESDSEAKAKESSISLLVSSMNVSGCSICLPVQELHKYLMNWLHRATVV